MIYLKWFIHVLCDLVLLITVPFVAPILSLFTRPMEHNESAYTWGWIYGTWDNPPQGDEGFIESRCPFPDVLDGWRGYINRVAWLLRNPLYNWQRKVGIKYNPSHALLFTGDEHISDKYKRPGYYFAKLYDRFDLVGFEFYCVYPWGFGKCLRVRLGYKLMTDKFQRYRFAPLVDTINPFKTYGDK